MSARRLARPAAMPSRSSCPGLVEAISADSKAPGSAACAPRRRIRLFQAVDDERAVIARHALVDAAERRGEVVRQHAAESSGHGDILLATDGVADDAALM